MKAFSEEEEVLSVAQVCKLLRISRNTLYKLLRTGEIKGFQINRIWKIRSIDLKNFYFEKLGYSVPDNNKQ